LDAAHEIFHKPFEVKLDYEEIETPKHYARWAGPEGIPPKLKAWRVHADKLAEKNYGLVSDGYGFEDSPDCERISGGVNSKGAGSVALGRQGNWFLWGFCAPPAEMTESARRAFLNAVVYMKRFDGKRPVVAREAMARQWAYFYAGLLGDEDAALAKRIRTKFHPKILEATGGETAKLKAYLKENEGWLVWEEYEDSAPSDSRADKKSTRIAVDEDAKTLGIANRDLALLDRCVEMLAKGDRPEAAARILERYTDQKHGKDAAAWRKWLDASRSRLFFTDTGGFRFRLKDEPAPAGAGKE
jgi:hypothetical protein